MGSTNPGTPEEIVLPGDRRPPAEKCDAPSVAVKASFSMWSPELYVNIGPIHFYASLWKTLLLAGIVYLAYRSRKSAAAEKQGSSRALAWIVIFLYLLSVAWPFGLKAFALPWDNPPGHLRLDGMDYGTGQGGPDPRVDSYGCNSEAAIRDGTFRVDRRQITELEQIGNLGGFFGGPALYSAHEESGGRWLIVRPTANCWIPYPQWI